MVRPNPSGVFIFPSSGVSEDNVDDMMWMIDDDEHYVDVNDDVNDDDDDVVDVNVDDDSWRGENAILSSGDNQMLRLLTPFCAYCTPL